MNKLSVIQNIKQVESKPYPHAIVYGALPEDVFQELHDTLPHNYVDSKPFSQVDPSQRIKWDTLVEDKWPISNIWKEFFDYHTSREYFDAVLNLFEPWSKNLKIPQDKIILDERTHKPNNTNCYTECQFVRHRVMDNHQTTRTAHLDNPLEIYAGLLYFKHPDDQSTGGGFNVHESPQRPQFYRKNNNEVKNAGPIARTANYQSNMFAMFWNTFDSVHSVEPRIYAQHPRWSINIIGRFNGTRMW